MCYVLYMAKDPALLLYTQDFLEGTHFMTDGQVGKYIRLLCHQHQHGKLSLKQMMKICRKRDPEIFSKFELDSDGSYFNKRLREEAVKRANYAESRRKNRLGKKTCGTYDKRMENETENEDLLLPSTHPFLNGIEPPPEPKPLRNE